MEKLLIFYTYEIESGVMWSSWKKKQRNTTWSVIKRDIPNFDIVFTTGATYDENT